MARPSEVATIRTFPALGWLRSHNQQRPTAEGLAVIGPEGLFRSSIAIVHRGYLRRACHVEVHQVVSSGTKVAVLILNPHCDKREVVAVILDHRAIW